MHAHIRFKIMVMFILPFVYRCSFAQTISASPFYVYIDIFPGQPHFQNSIHEINFHPEATLSLHLSQLCNMGMKTFTTSSILCVKRPEAKQIFVPFSANQHSAHSSSFAYDSHRKRACHLNHLQII